MLESAVKQIDASVRLCAQGCVNNTSDVDVEYLRRRLRRYSEVWTAFLLTRGYILMFSEPKLWVCDLSLRPRVPGQYLDMLACHRLLKKSVDAPEVNENIWFLPDLFTSQLGHMSWQVTRVLRRIGDRRGGLLLFFHTGRPGHNPETQMNMFLAQKTSRWNWQRLTCIQAKFRLILSLFMLRDLFHLPPAIAHS